MQKMSRLKNQGKIDQDLESPESDDDLERLLLDLSNDEDQELNSIQRRKAIISEFDSELLQSIVDLYERIGENNDNDYVLMKATQLS